MSKKEELKDLILSLSPEELEIAIKVFQEYSLKKQAEPPPPPQKDLK